MRTARRLLGQGEVALAPGQSHSFDFKRADLPAAGEPGTGRLQVRSAIQRRFFPGIVSRISAGTVDRFPGALELVDQGTGTTMLLCRPCRPRAKPRVAFNSRDARGLAQDAERVRAIQWSLAQGREALCDNSQLRAVRWPRG